MGTNALDDDIAGEFPQDKAEGEEGLAEIDILQGQMCVLADGVGERVTDVLQVTPSVLMCHRRGVYCLAEGSRTVRSNWRKTNMMMIGRRMKASTRRKALRTALLSVMSIEYSSEHWTSALVVIVMELEVFSWWWSGLSSRGPSHSSYTRRLSDEEHGVISSSSCVIISIVQECDGIGGGCRCTKIRRGTVIRTASGQ